MIKASVNSLFTVKNASVTTVALLNSKVGLMTS